MASHRYRSQIFQAFARQTVRLGDRVAQAWRQAKLTATWGTQILLYPIYALYQSTRILSHSIGQTVQRILPQLQSAPAFDPANPPLDEQVDRDAPVDTPIVRSLIAVAGLELSNLTPILPAAEGGMTIAGVAPIVVVDLPGTGALQTGDRPQNERGIVPHQASAIDSATVRVRGFASRLDDRRLVLTTIHNQLLDVLTADQQMQLQQRIVWELASYRRLLRLRHSGRSLPLPADSPHLLPPIRTFARLMAWMQQSPIAIATNLFGEAAQLAAAPPAPVLPPTLPSPRLVSRWSWLELRPTAAAPSEAAAIVIAEAGAVAPTTPNSPRRNSWWKRKRLAAAAASQTPIVASGRSAAALPPQGLNRDLATTDRSTATPASQVQPTELSDREAEAIALKTEPTTPAAAPTWIETEARLVGYVKHPLEQLLEWLDAGMLWIETTLSNFWHWLSRHSR